MSTHAGLIGCTHCGTNFKVEWHNDSPGYVSYQCPNCNQSSRVYWNPPQIEKVERC